MQVKTLLYLVVFAFALMSLKLFNDLRTMQIRMGIGVVLLRYEHPLLFWLMIGLECLVIGALLAIIYSVFFVLPYQIMS